MLSAFPGAPYSLRAVRVVIEPTSTSTRRARIWIRANPCSSEWLLECFDLLDAVFSSPHASDIITVTVNMVRASPTAFRLFYTEPPPFPALRARGVLELNISERPQQRGP